MSFTAFLVDDDPGVLKALCRIMRSAGYEARAYASPAEFLCDHDPSLPGCAVLDLNMPGLDGLELQRRLAEAGASFAELLDEVRREIARDQLVRTDVDVAEISFLLGFSNPNSLHRAFKRWERMTPLSYRRAARGPRAAVGG